jgi:DNA-directed RNA polymerase subunit beta
MQIQKKIHPIQLGANVRVSYSMNNNSFDVPNLIDTQIKSFDWFFSEGINEVLKEVSPIIDHSGNLSLEFLFCVIGKPKYKLEDCKEHDATYSVPIKIRARLINKDIDEIKEQDVYVGEFPIMTDTGTFVINGAERVIVSQLVRSPGLYFGIDFDKVGNQLISTTVIPNRGSWIEYETDSNGVVYVRIDRTRKLPVTILLRAFGFETNDMLLDLFGNEQMLLNTLDKDSTRNLKEALIEIYKKIRPGEPPTFENAETLFKNMFLDPHRYDLARVGRYKINKKLNFIHRITNFKLADDVIDLETGEVLFRTGTLITDDIAEKIQNSAIAFVYISIDDVAIKVISNLSVDADFYLKKYNITAAEVGIWENVYWPVLKEILESSDDVQELKDNINKNISLLIPRLLTTDDILASINYIFNLTYGIGNKDNIDHLGNRRIRTVGELLQNQFRSGIIRTERVIRERMSIQDSEIVTPQSLINIRSVAVAIREFFASSQLSQFMEQTNPLGELTHKRRLSALGPGGLSRERAGFSVRDVHSSHYGRVCPIETPEGPNIGLISSLTTYARINSYGFIETPYRIVDKFEDGSTYVTDKIVYITADDEEKYVIAQANELLDENNRFVNKRVSGRYREEISEFDRNRIDLMDVSPKQMVSVATSLIPFLENDDVTRALMGSNMQRQAVPLVKTEAPIIGTGMEYKVGYDSGVTVICKNTGVVEDVVSNRIIIKCDDGHRDNYKLIKYVRSNQSTCINQRPIVNAGQKVIKGEIIADGPSTSNGELALGRDMLIGFMTWEGYNYEDAVLLGEHLVYDDVYTSVHIEEYEIEASDTKLGPEEITRDIPNIGDDMLKDLDESGIVRIGAIVKPNSILVGKVTPKGETELSAEERLLRAIFGDKAREVRDTSLRVPHGEGGVVVDVKIFTRANKDELPAGVNKLVRVYIAQKRKISVGDKMAGRHGNKGVVSRILPIEDMPFLPNGRPLDIVLNPLGVPSRMNIGQVLETHLGLAAKVLNWKIATPVFEGANEYDIMDTLDLANDYANMTWHEFENKWKGVIDDFIFEGLEKNKDKIDEWKGVPISRDGKIKLRDGRTGEYFDNPITVGYMHYLKLHHLVDDKIHARSTGPYSLVTQQPLGGKAQFGGQRFGEMEVWALEAYGAAYTLQEMLTVKSDDVSGRVKTYEAIVKGDNIPKPGIPESFKVLLKELQSLGLDMKILSNDRKELELKNDDDNDDSDIAVISKKEIEEQTGMTFDEISHSHKTKNNINDIDDTDDINDNVYDSDDDNSCNKELYTKDDEDE